MGRTADDAFRDLTSSVLGFVALADRTYREEAHVLGFVRSLAGEVGERVTSRPIPGPGEVVRFLGRLVATDERTATRRHYRAGRPVISPSPTEGLAATVLNVPGAEIDHFLDVVVKRYLRTLRQHWVVAAAQAFRHRHLAEVTDGRFASVLAQTAVSRLLCPWLDDADRAAFGADLTRLRGRAFKVDLTAIGLLDTFPGVHVAPTVTLLERDDATGSVRAVAIRLGELLTRPGDGASWELAKLFALQGAGLAMLMGVHPRVHFPMDPVNGATKALLPRRHPLYRLLEPHLYMQLPLNYAVLYVGRSVAHNDQREIYTPFPGTKEGFFRVTRAYHAGIPGNSAYPRYRYPMRPPKVWSAYGTFLGEYHAAIRRLVRQVVRAITPRDPHVSRWAGEIASHVPGFPDGRRIWCGENLVQAVTTFVADVSVEHSADHHGYASVPPHVMPLRLRREPPRTKDCAPVDRRALVYWEDLFRQYMAHEMYFKPTAVRPLAGVRYRFAPRELAWAAERFRADLRAVDARWAGKGFIPLEEIATSIQF